MDHNSQGWQLARFNPQRCTIQLETVVRGTDIPTQGYAIGVLYAGPDGPIPENHLAAAAPDLLEACKLVKAALERAQADGWLLWLHDMEHCAIHETASERLENVIAKAERRST